MLKLAMLSAAPSGSCKPIWYRVYLTTASKMHYGLSIKETRVLAYNFAVANGKQYPSSWDTNKCSGKRFYYDFMTRHKEALSLRKPQATSLARSTSFNRENVGMFFNKLEETMAKHMFTADRVYNVDESGISTVHVPVRVIAPKGSKQVGSMTSGERGVNVTIIACVNALGNSVPPMMIFPRVNFRDIMLKGAPPGTIGDAHPSGWSNGEKFLIFLKHFIKHANPSQERKVLLILDNHESHITVESINLAKDAGVVMLTFPPHTSHKLQPLDRSVFGPFKKHYNTACNNWLLLHPGKPLTIYDIAECVGCSYPLAFTPANIHSGFRVSGIFPVNRNIFRDDEFLSSYATDRPNPHITNDANPVDGDSQIPTTSGCATSGVAAPNGHVVTITSGNPSVSPQDIRPYPKAAPRTTSAKRGGRKRGSCRILTDTPEKTEIEIARALRELKKENVQTKAARKLILKPNPATVKKQLRKKVRVSLPSSSEDEIVSLASESDAELERSISPEQMQSYSTDTPTKGEFCLVRVTGKKTVKYYVAEVMNDDDLDLGVKYLKRMGLTNKFFYHDNTIYEIALDDIVFKLPQPETSGGTERQCMLLAFGVSFDTYDVE